MTASPTTIERHATLAKAREKMRDWNIRHLVVVQDGELEGIISERDLATIERFHDVDPAKVEVEEAMAPLLFRVQADTPIAEVAMTMAEKRYGSCVVVDGGGKAIGLFTTTDALRALALVVR
jgi:CBS domain-containing protein